MSGAALGESLNHEKLMETIGYSPIEGRRDEAVSVGGEISAAWEPLFESVSRHGVSVLGDWRAVAMRLSRERGLAYRTAGLEEEGEGWSLDPIPWVFSPERWGILEEGIVQRTRLYDLLLRDAYGEQQMLKERLIPAEILLNHGGFVRPLHDLTPGEEVIGLGISAFDLAADNSGNTLVVNDRFDHPFGLGLSLENRSIVNMVLPRLFRRCGVRRVGQFFIDWFEHLQSRARTGEGDPFVVIVDSSLVGEDSEIGFLANYCGIQRVHPSDLIARGGRIWIKSLSRLVPVDVIWKTMPGRQIDSLEAEFRGAPGVAGLFEAMRLGGVTLASHPGSEALQSPGLYPYLEDLCQFFLGEELKIKPVQSWWCGEPSALSHVLSNLSSMVIKSVGHHRGFRTVYGRRQSEEDLVALRQKILGNPAGFVGQEEIEISTVPTSRRDRLVPRGAVLRMFSFPTGDQSVNVMPGGLARVSTADGLVVSTREQGDSKDVWVRSYETPEPFSIASQIGNLLPSSPRIVPSRAGENLFWTGRYAERAHFLAKFSARIVEGRGRGFTYDEEFEARHESLLFDALLHVFEFEFPEEETDPLQLMLSDPKCTVGVAYCLDRFYNATQVTRETWSPASIVAIEACCNQWKEVVDRAPSHLGVERDLDSLLLNLHAFLGLNLDSMTRKEGWAMLDAGRRIERGQIVCGLLSFLVECGESGDMITLLNESILHLLDSARTYQRRFRSSPETARTALLLMGEPDYPRSLISILLRLEEVLEKLPAPENKGHPRETLSGAAESLRRYLEQLESEVEAGLFRMEETAKEISKLSDSFAALSDALTVSYFSHTVEM